MFSRFPYPDVIIFVPVKDPNNSVKQDFRLEFLELRSMYQVILMGNFLFGLFVPHFSSKIL